MSKVLVYAQMDFTAKIAVKRTALIIATIMAFVKTLLVSVIQASPVKPVNINPARMNAASKVNVKKTVHVHAIKVTREMIALLLIVLMIVTVTESVSMANVNVMINLLDLIVQKNPALLIVMETDSVSKESVTVKMDSLEKIVKLKAALTPALVMENVITVLVYAMKDSEEKIVVLEI